MQRFEGKTAVVTGAASGIGRALAERFAAAGMQVVLADVETDAPNQAVEELAMRRHGVIGVPTNTMVRNSVQALAERSIAEFGKVHLLCNNAGVVSMHEARTAVWEVADNDWQWVMGVNFWGMLYGLQAFLPHMIGHGEEGHVVNTASLAALMPGGGTYGVSKHAVPALSEGLHRDLKSRGSKIGASVLYPGFVNMQIFSAERNRPDELGRADPSSHAQLVETGKVMLAQSKQPQEIAESVLRSIRENRFYILPHEELDAVARARLEQVLARAQPLDLYAMATRASQAPAGS